MLLTEPSSPWRKLPWDLNLDSIVPEGIDKLIEKQIREVFKEYIKALKKQNVNKYRYFISNQSIKAEDDDENKEDPFLAAASVASGISGQIQVRMSRAYDNNHCIAY